MTASGGLTLSVYTFFFHLNLRLLKEDVNFRLRVAKKY